MRKKIGNAVKRNRIKRKLKMAANKILKKHKIFDSNKVYLISANDKAYKAPFAEIYMQMKKSLGNI